MTPQEGGAVTGRRQAGPENTPRLRLKPKAPATGDVDGAWWPHSDDLPKELPDLLAVLSVRLEAVTRVMYNPAEWVNAPEKLLTGGREVLLEGSRLQPPGTVEVHGINRKKVVLLVVPHQMDPDLAHDTLMVATAPDNAATVDDLLMISTQDREASTRAAATERRWTADD